MMDRFHGYALYMRHPSTSLLYALEGHTKRGYQRALYLTLLREYLRVPSLVPCYFVIIIDVRVYTK